MEYKYIVGSVIILVVAVIYFLYPPGQSNAMYGYRTPRSRKSPDNWKKANRLASIILLVLSVFLLSISLLFAVFQWHGIETIWFNTFLLGIVLIFFIVEIKLKNTHQK